MKYSFQEQALKQAQKQHKSTKKLNLITLEELMTNSKYRVMSNQELTDFLSRWNNSISIEDYKKLEGQFVSDKARILKERWAKEVIVESNPIKIIFLDIEPEKVQKQSKPERITLEQLLIEPKYREMGEAELSELLNRRISFRDWSALEGGDFFWQKARILKAKWAKEKEKFQLKIKENKMEQDFKPGQILYCCWKNGHISMCIFKSKEIGGRFQSTNYTKFNLNGSYRYSLNEMDSFFINPIKSVQWQLATEEQIKQYGYEKYLNRKLQFNKNGMSREEILKRLREIGWNPLDEKPIKVWIEYKNIYINTCKSVLINLDNVSKVETLCTIDGWIANSNITSIYKKEELQIDINQLSSKVKELKTKIVELQTNIENIERVCKMKQ